MSKIHKALLPALLGLAMLVGTAIFLHNTQEFIYIYREQHLLFLSDWDSLLSLIQQRGGLSVMLSGMMVQSFTSAWAGPIIATTCMGLSAVLLWLGLRKINPSVYLFPISSLPGLLLLAALSDISLYYTSLSSMLIFSALFCIGCHSFRFGKIIGIVCCILLFGIFYFTACIPDGFYDPRLSSPSYTLFPAISIVFCLLLFWCCRFLPQVKPLLKSAGSILASIIIAFGAARMASGLVKPENYTIYELNSYAIKGQWDKLLAACQRTSLNNTLYMNYLNLALSYQGQLLDQLFRYPQQGASSLICEYQPIPDILQLQSMILLRMGNIAGAQNRAFSASVCNQQGSPSSLQTLVLTNLTMGYYDVAEKYIAVLEKTKHYHDWAAQHRKFLNNDSAIEGDEELGMYRKSLIKADHFALSKGYLVDQDLILDANQQNTAARDYLIAMALLAKDKESIQYICDKYSNTPVLSSVPRVLQEGIYSLAETSPEFLSAHGISEETSRRYDDFVSKVMASRKAGRNPSADLLREYGNTYWYYLMFK